MNVLEKITKDIGQEVSTSWNYGDKIEAECKAMYDKYICAYHSQYMIGTPPRMMQVMALPYEKLAALSQSIGSLIKLNRKDDTGENGSYLIVEKWGLNDKGAILKCRDAKGKEVIVGYDEYEPADIPDEIVEIVKSSILKDVKCPLANKCSE